MVRRQMSAVLAVSLGLVAAIVLVQLQSHNSPNSLYEVVRQPVREYNGLMPSPRLALNGLQRAQLFRDPRYRFANQHRILLETPDVEPAFPPQEAEEEKVADEEKVAEEVKVAQEEQEASPVAEAQPTEDEIVEVPQVEEHEELQEPDNALGDEVIDLPKISDANDIGDMYVSGKDAEQNRSTPTKFSLPRTFCLSLTRLCRFAATPSSSSVAPELRCFTTLPTRSMYPPTSRPVNSSAWRIRGARGVMDTRPLPTETAKK
jgi:hypothetical protein